MLTVLYDDGCGRCQRFMRVAQALDFGKRLEPLGLSDPKVAERFPYLSSADLMRELYVVEETGKVYRGVRAVRRLAVELPVIWPLATVMYLPGVIHIGDWIYRRLADARRHSPAGCSPKHHGP